MVMSQVFPRFECSSECHAFSDGQKYQLAAPPEITKHRRLGNLQEE